MLADPKILLIAGVFFLCLISVSAVGSGSSTSTAASTCGSTTTCTRSGSSNYMSRSLNYDTSTGVFTGTFTSNSCPEFEFFTFNGVSSVQGPTYQATCYQQPIPQYSAPFPRVLPTRGVAGFTISGGSDIYGPMENGFDLGFACTNGLGTCPSGMDVPTCQAKLKHECGVDNFKYQVFGDDCGGHATPYHFHTDVRCTKTGYSGVPLAGTAHSPLTGVMLDGRGLYGLYESGANKPTDLDACGGHYGPVPTTNVPTATNDTYPAASNVYHYHTQTVAPYVPACFGPVTSLAQCKGLYATCASGSSSGTICTIYGGITYQYDCPCFRNMPTNETFNQVFTNTTSCGGGSSSGPSSGSGSHVAPAIFALVFAIFFHLYRL